MRGPSVLWEQLFAWTYDRALRSAEDAGLRRMRAELLVAARGRTLEIGAGTGLNLPHYPPAVADLVLLEPSPHMAAKLRGKKGSVAARIVEADGERLPFTARLFDTVVVTLVLCTVREPEAVLREIARVLKLGGRLLFLEHVRSEDDRLARWQDRLAGPWRVVANGCHCNRDSRALVDAAPFVLESIRDVALMSVGPLVRPAIVGSAVLGEAGNKGRTVTHRPVPPTCDDETTHRLDRRRIMTTTEPLIIKEKVGVPIACDMTNAPDTPEERFAEYGRLFDHALLGRERTADGVEFQLAAKPGVADWAADLARREAACCPFFSFHVAVSGDHVVWRTSSQAGPTAQAFLEELHALPERTGAGLKGMFDRLDERGLSIVSPALGQFTTASAAPNTPGAPTNTKTGCGC